MTITHTCENCARLTAELNASTLPFSKDYADMQEQIDQLTAERDALAADAERWRWAMKKNTRDVINVIYAYTVWNGEDDFQAEVDRRIGRKIHENTNQE